MTKKLLTIFLIPAIWCQGQTFDLATRKATGQIKHARYEIGDIDGRGQFEARLRSQFWDEDVLEFQLGNVRGTAATVNNMVVLPWPGMGSMEWVEDEGLLRWRMKFPSKPPRNTYTYTVTGWENFNWYVQLDDRYDWTPELFQSSRPSAWQKVGQWCHRWHNVDANSFHEAPVNIYGSIDVVHKSKVNNKYKTGKALGIPRPKLTDALGAYTWAEPLEFADGKLTVTLPAAWLAHPARAYPVVVNDEFGYHTVGGYWTNWNKNQARFGGGPYSCSGGTMNFIEAYMQGYGGDEDFVAACYPDGGSNDPSGSSPVGISTAVTIGVSDPAAWVQFDSSGTLTSDNQWPTLWHGGDHNQGQVAHAWNTGAHWYDAATSMPDPAAATYLNAFQFSIYVDYTAGGPTTTPQIW